jgi:hypothetical protein
VVRLVSVEVCTGIYTVYVGTGIAPLLNVSLYDYSTTTSLVSPSYSSSGEPAAGS